MSRPNEISRAVGLAAILLSGALAGCHSGSDARTAKSGSPADADPPGKMKRGTVRFETSRGSWIIDVEIARTQEEHARGLMFRRELLPDHGMIFVFEESAVQRFWMHNTLLRLDMLFLGEDRGVVGVVENAEPKTDKGRSVDKPSRYVLEVAGGEAASHGVGPGARAQFVDIDE